MHLSQIALLAAILLFSPQSEVTATPLAGRPGAGEADEELGAGLQRRDSEPAQSVTKSPPKRSPIKRSSARLAYQARKRIIEGVGGGAPTRQGTVKPALVRRSAYSPQNAYNKPSKPNAYTRPSYSDESESDESDSDEDSDASDEESDEDSEDESDEESEDESDEDSDESEDESGDESGDETEDESDDESDDDESDNGSDYESGDEYEYEETTEESTEETTTEESEETITTTYSRN